MKAEIYIDPKGAGMTLVVTVHHVGKLDAMIEDTLGDAMLSGVVSFKAEKDNESVTVYTLEKEVASPYTGLKLWVGRLREVGFEPTLVQNPYTT